jgi:hypothetical protein
MTDADASQPAAGETNGFAPVYMIELLATKPITFDREAVRRDLMQSLGRVEIPDEAGDTRLFSCRDYPVVLADATVCAQLACFAGKGGATPAASPMLDPIRQSRTIRDPAARVARLTHSLLLCDMMARSLDHAQRRTILAAGLRAVLAHAEVDLVHMTATQQYVDAEETRKTLAEDDQRLNPTWGFLNVRFFRIDDRPGEMVFDTLGLNALGLTDFQVHCRGCEPGQVARLLNDLGHYAFEKGDVIVSGHTVQGIDGGKWKVQNEMSLLEPKRVVLDINPGPAYAAGKRNTSSQAPKKKWGWW